MKIRHIYRYALNCLFQGITLAQTNLIRAPLTQHSINELTLGQNGGKQMALKQVLGWEPRWWHYVERAFRNTPKRQPHVLGLILKFHPCSWNQHKKGPSEAFMPRLHWQKKRSRPTMVTPSDAWWGEWFKNSWSMELRWMLPHHPLLPKGTERTKSKPPMNHTVLSNLTWTRRRKQDNKQENRPR